MNISLSNTWGGLTFIGPLSYVGEVKRNAGVFLENYYVNGKVSNIYTAFRYLIQDFSILGPLYINFFLAALYLGFRNIDCVKTSRAIRIFIVFCAILSTNVTPFVHNSVMFGMILCIGSDTFSRLLNKCFKKELLVKQ